MFLIEASKKLLNMHVYNKIYYRTELARCDWLIVEAVFFCSELASLDPCQKDLGRYPPSTALALGK